MKKVLVKEFPFGKAIARVTVSAFVKTYEEYMTEELMVVPTIEIIANGKVVGSCGHADILECNEIFEKTYEKANLDKSKMYTRIGDRVFKEGAEIGHTINAAIEEMTNDLTWAIGYETETEKKQKQEKEEIEEAKAVVEQAEKEGVENLMSKAEIKAWRVNYNNLHNEGEEGYIPVRVSKEEYHKALKMSDIRSGYNAKTS